MPFIANEIFLCEMASISSKFFTAEVAKSSEMIEIFMTPTSEDDDDY